LIRLFFAINLPPTSRERIAVEALPLREAAPSVAWIRTPLLHITLKFVGEREDALVEPLVRTARDVAARARPLHLAFAQFGAFPNLRRPHVVWVGIRTGADELLRVAADLDGSCEALGIAPDARPFRPHLTLGRVKRDLSKKESTALAQAAGGASSQEAVIVDSIDLMRSDLGRTGPAYTVLASAVLGGA
jgi:2'-5' RNA ligase